MTFKQKNRALSQAVDRVLWEEWDPIGVNDFSEHDDEYRSYVAQIVRLLSSGADKVKLTQHLDRLVFHSMGIPNTPFSRTNNAIAAEKLLKLRDAEG